MQHPTQRHLTTRRERARAAARRAVRASVATAVAGVLAAGALTLSAHAPAGTTAAAPETAALRTVANPVTPGDFTGFGFDQCLAPSQRAMDAWLQHSPFLAVGIYISGNSRACRSQPNLTPTWVRTQLNRGWRLLPITLGPQSTCVGRFPRYGKTIDPTISNDPAGGYRKARAQGLLEADRAVTAAKALGITPRSTLWYDLEGWSDYRNATCRESALGFLSGWTHRLRKLGYVAGVYSSAGSGMKVLDDARVQRRPNIILPDRIWIARWDGKANTSTTYIREDGWRPGNRMKQYQGGHHETWGGVTINIDSNFLDLGSRAAPAEQRCGGTALTLPTYGFLKPRTARFTPDGKQVRALKCLLREQGAYQGKMGAFYNPKLRRAVRQWRVTHGMPARTDWTRKAWVTLFVAGAQPVLKVGSKGDTVRDLQRALRTIYPRAGVTVDGVFTFETRNTLRAFQKARGVRRSGNANAPTWRALATKPFGF